MPIYSPLPKPRPRKLAKWYGTPAGNYTTISATSNRQYFNVFDVEVPHSVDRIGCQVTTGYGIGGAVAGGVVRLGIYLDDGTGWPGALLLDGGTASSTAAGSKSVTVAQTLAPGRYWLSACIQSASAGGALQGVNGNGENDPWVGMTNQSDLYTCSVIQDSVTGAFAAAVPSGNVASPPNIQVRVA